MDKGDNPFKKGKSFDETEMMLQNTESTIRTSPTRPSTSNYCNNDSIELPTLEEIFSLSEDRSNTLNVQPKQPDLLNDSSNTSNQWGSSLSESKKSSTDSQDKWNSSLYPSLRISILALTIRWLLRHVIPRAVRYHRASSSLSTPLWKRNRSSLNLGKVMKHERRMSDADEKGMFHFKKSATSMAAAAAVASKLEKKPLDYFHPQCRLMKEKGSEKRRGTDGSSKPASAVGKDAVLEKLQVGSVIVVSHSDLCISSQHYHLIPF